MNVDVYGQVINCYESAMTVRRMVKQEGSCAIALSLGNMTMFHIIFINLGQAIPLSVIYEDGSNRGLNIAIDRKSSYALPWNAAIGEEGYLMEKWKVREGDAIALLPFFNTVLTGKDYFKKG